MNSSVSYEVARATMAAIADYLEADFDQLGITIQEFKLTHREAIWRREERLRVVRTLDALLYGTTSMLGLNRISLPAEYIAAVIATFVAPCNRHLACIYLADIGGPGRAAIDLGNGNDPSTCDPVTPTQLFSLVLLLSQDDMSTEVRQRFSERLGLAVEAANPLKGATNA